MTLNAFAPASVAMILADAFDSPTTGLLVVTSFSTPFDLPYDETRKVSYEGSHFDSSCALSTLYATEASSSSVDKRAAWTYLPTYA